MTTIIGQESVWSELIDKLDIPCHIFLTGPAGSGKTTIIKDFLQEYAKKNNRIGSNLWGVETNEECLLLGPDIDRGIQTIRGQVSLFIRQKSIGQQLFRWVIIDDVDTFPQISQQALRRPMESYSHITRFIFIGTSEEDLIPALRSRSIHISMNTIDLIRYKNNILKSVGIKEYNNINEDMWSWILNISGSNISEIFRLVTLIKDVSKTSNKPINFKMVKMLCSAPFHLDFIPLLNSLSIKNYVEGIRALLFIWKKGYAYEDILESFQTIHMMFGNSDLNNDIIIHKFLINAWISYCKGNTSILSLQNVLYNTITCN
jgi:DNA polymerase III delta prime subunit